MTGAGVKNLLLALADGDSMVIDGVEWTSFEASGFEVEDLLTGDVGRVGREKVMSMFEAMKTYEVLR